MASPGVGVCGWRHLHPSKNANQVQADSRNFIRTNIKQSGISLAHPDGGVGVDGKVDHLPPARRSRQGAARPHHDSAADVVEHAGVPGVVQELRGGRDAANRPRTEKI